MGIKPVKGAVHSEDKRVSCNTVENKYLKLDLEGFRTTPVAVPPTTVASGSDPRAAHYRWVRFTEPQRLTRSPGLSSCTMKTEKYRGWILGKAVSGIYSEW